MLNPGTKLGHYEIVSPLGAGGMGEVYRTRDTELNRDHWIGAKLSSDEKFFASHLEGKSIIPQA